MQESKNAKDLEQELEKAYEDYETLKAKLARVQRQNDEVRLELQELRTQKLKAEQDTQMILSSFWWRATKPGRIVTGGLKKFIHSNPITHVPITMLLSIKRNGFKRTFKEKTYKFKMEEQAHAAQENYMMMYANPRFSNELSIDEKELQRKAVFVRDVKISIVVPLYNTPENFLKDMINSVIEQTYENWELCLADGSVKENTEVERICKDYCKNYPNIVYKRLEKNLGISGNTNEGLKMVTGDYISLLDHDDILKQDALYEVVKAINETGAEYLYSDELTFEGTIENVVLVHLKPDFAIDNLRANNYICHLSTFSTALLKQVGGFREECNGSQDYDLTLRLTEKANKVHHIRKVLYFWRAHPQSVAGDLQSKPYVFESAKRALRDHFSRLGIEADVKDGQSLSIYKPEYVIKGNPKVSIIIPNKDQMKILKMCIETIINKSTYTNYEIIVIENNSTSDEIFEYYKDLEKEPFVKVVTYKGEFNYSKINNFGVTFATGEYLLLLNNDIEIISERWIEELLMYAQRDDVGIVGAKLYYPNQTIQHCGIGFGLVGLAGHLFKHTPRESLGYMGRLSYAQNITAVTGACLMVKASIFHEVGGLEEQLQVAFNDIDFCLKVRDKGYLNVVNPYCEAYHHESISRGYEDTPEKIERFVRETVFVRDKWKKEYEASDPYLHPEIDRDYEDLRAKL